MLHANLKQMKDSKLWQNPKTNASAGNSKSGLRATWPRSPSIQISNQKAEWDIASPLNGHNHEVRHTDNNEDNGKPPSANAKKSRGRSDIPATFPPLPLESDLFTPLQEKVTRKEKSVGLLADR